jgi:2-phospho-L-lactate guanylyltransferase
MHPAVVIPVKRFGAAKQRLADVLDADERAALAKQMAAAVIAAAAPLPVAVVCDDEDVRAWATAAGATALWTPGLGLDGAVREGVDRTAATGHDIAIVAHADLPLATGLAWLAEFDGITLVPDRHRDGTNVIVVPTALPFTFAYGHGSFHRHLAAARATGLRVRVVQDAALGWDVDLPADLDHPSLRGIA